MGKCDSCDRPAIMAARDYVTIEDHKAGVRRHEPHGAIRRGCSEHPVESAEAFKTVEG